MTYIKSCVSKMQTNPVPPAQVQSLLSTIQLAAQRVKTKFSNPHKSTALHSLEIRSFYHSIPNPTSF